MTPFTLPIPKFIVYSGMSESKIRGLLKDGDLESVVVGGRRMILVESYHRMIEKALAEPQDARHNKAGAIPPYMANTTMAKPK